jgi:hypothetical protein
MRPSLVILATLGFIFLCPVGRATAERNAESTNQSPVNIDLLMQRSDRGAFQSLLRDLSEHPVQAGPPNCSQLAGSGSCGGYNKDTKQDCGKCYRANTHKCTDGTYVEVCDYLPRECGCQ